MNDDEPLPKILKLLDILSVKAAEAETRSDTLASVMRAGFQQVNRRLDNHDARFERIEERLGQIDQRFDGIDRRFNGIDQRLDRMGTKIDHLGAEFASYRRENDARISAIEQG